MSRKSQASKIVRKSASEIPRATREDLNRLRAAMKGKIDTSEIPEQRMENRLKRDADGRLPRRRSIIREAVTRQMKRLGLTAYRLWKVAREHYPALSQSAVHEFLQGRRQLELPSVEALLLAADLRLVRRNSSKNGVT